MTACVPAVGPVTFTKQTKRKQPRAYAAPAPRAPLFDTHAHLTCFWSKDSVEVLRRAARVGVRRLVTLYDPIGDDFSGPAAFSAQLDAWLQATCAPCGAAGAVGDGPDAEDGAAGRGHAVDCEAEAIRDLADHVCFLAGAHPYGAPDYTDAVHEQLLAALDDPRCAGVGEIGLDYHDDAADGVMAAPHDLQQRVMARQLAVAVARNVPVELHLRNDAGDETRAAHADALRVLTEVGLPQAGCVLHCFGEDRATMERFVELGCFVAFGGAATFKRNERIREAFAACPLDRILFETDCPYMAPEPIRGLECEPAMIAFTAEALACDRAGRTGEEPDVIVRAAWENACRLFG